ncbi:class I SAM-dependent methyltransferase [Eisenibacter elegans]|uniref:class I SAM-dependent methyltransferase n=1 Tax=Eisenibacter elegans TaxID=997 RepID=UPI0004236CD5|nr:methyltransferase domain-containing protein [Eisenibacter elegans]
MKSTFLLFLLVFCNSAYSFAQEHKHHQGEANQYMHQTEFEALVQRFESPERRAWQKPEAVISFLGKLKGKTVMDLGAGTGYFAVLAAKAGAKTVIAADVNQQFLDYIAVRSQQEQLPQIHTRKAAYERAPLTQAEVDLLFMVNVYHHIERRTAYFEEVAKGLRKAGEVVVVDFKRGDLPHGPPDRLKLSPQQVLEELTLAGFELVSLDETTLPYQYMLKVRKK